jgi:hypothetical protein
LVNVVICLVAGGMLGLLTNRWIGLAIPDPLTMSGITDPQINSLAHQALFLINYVSFVLLLFNLLPIFPLDGGRIAQSLLWPRYGYTRSMSYAVRVGYVGAIVLFIFGAVASEWMVIGVALFGAFACYATQKQLQWTDAAMGIGDDDPNEYALTAHEQKEDEHGNFKQSWSERKAERAAVREKLEAEEVDRILAKIAQSGLDSLTRAEKSLLQRATERKRQER